MRVAPAPAAELTRAQLVWLAALVVLAQCPLWGALPVWIAVTGSALAAVRLLLPAHRLPPAQVRRWLLPLLALAVALGVRAQYGYFLARDPCVAFLYVLVGLKYIEATSPRDGGLLACLALFLTLTQFFYAQTIGAALIALPVVLVLGGVLAALRAAPGTGADWKAPLAATARMLLQGVPLALLLFLVFPRLAAPLWGTSSDFGRSGLSDTMRPGSISELSLSDAVAFRVDFNGSQPAPEQRYWRGPVLTRFDGLEWSTLPGIRSGELTNAGGRTIEYTVTLEPQNRPWLLALEEASSLPQAVADNSGLTSGSARLVAVARVTSDRELLANLPITQVTRYVQRSSLGDRFPARAGADPRDTLRLPRGNPRTVAFARELRGRSASDRAYIAAILDWFREQAFVYTLAPPLLEGDIVDGFLFDTRRGFCEHYAAAFVVLLRAAGIPARVVTGYQGGEINPTGNYMIVRDSDAHAWAEALLDGMWQRFDPTAAVAPSRIQGGLGAALPQGEPVPYLARLDMTWLKQLRLHWDAVNYQWQRGIVDYDVRQQHNLWRDLGLEGARGWLLVAIGSVMVVVWGVAFLWFGHWFAHRRDPALAIWTRLCARLARAGLPRRADEGPLAYGQRAAARWPQWSEQLQRIAESYALLRYGPPDATRNARIAGLRASVFALPTAHALRGKART
jgi:transglutaminase-like putative cysteine protease